MTTPSSSPLGGNFETRCGPIPFDDATHLIADGGDIVHRLDLLPEHFEFSGAAKHEFHRRWSLTYSNRLLSAPAADRSRPPRAGASGRDLVDQRRIVVAPQHSVPRICGHSYPSAAAMPRTKGLHHFPEPSAMTGGRFVSVCSPAILVGELGRLHPFRE